MRSIVGGAARAAPPQVQPRLDLQAAAGCTCTSYNQARAMKVILRLKDLHAYGKICESVHKTASANKICKRKRSFAKV